MTKNLAIIPARSGSKGLKNKNIKILNGKPLIAYTIEAAQRSELFDEICVSTDSKKYAEIANDWGANTPFLRNEELSSDKASSWDVVKDVLNSYRKVKKEFDTVALLQPTSPLRTAANIIEGYKKMQQKNANAVISVCEVDHSPLWCNTLPKDESLDSFLSQAIVEQPRQQLSTYYRINGALYIIKTEYLMTIDNIYKEKTYAYKMDKGNSIDIDDITDFKIAEALLHD